MAIKDKLISNATYLSLNWFFVTLFSMAFWIILGKALTPSSYGTVALFFQISTLLSGISVFGLGSAISRLIPELLERDRKDKIHGMIMFSFKSVFVIALVFALTLLIFSAQISTLLKLQKEVLWAVSISIMIMVIVSLFDNIYHGFQNMRKLFLTTFYGGLSKIVFTVSFIFLGFDYFGAIIALFLSFVVNFLSKIEKKIFRISKSSVVDKNLIFKFSIPAFTILIFSTILNETQLILLSSMKTAEVTGLFAVATKISSVIPVIPVIFISALSPIISGLSANKNSKPRQSYLIKLVFRYNLVFVLPIALFLILFSRYAILFFSGPEYLAATNFLIILIAAFVFQGLAGFLLSNLYSIGEPKKYRDIQIVSSLTYLLLSIPMTYYFSAVGLASTFLLSTVLLFSLSAFFLKKHLSFTPPLKDVGKIICGCLISATFLVLSKPYIDNFWVASAFAIIAGVIYVLSLLLMKFYLEEDLMILDFLANRIPIFKKKAIRIRNFIAKFVKRSYR
jgi:O-antigen/teichoic acid export membrane protein